MSEHEEIVKRLLVELFLAEPRKRVRQQQEEVRQQEEEKEERHEQAQTSQGI